jgi:adenine-specific DNA-methyltransferase
MTPSWADTDDITRYIEEMNACPDKVGLFTEMYASKRDNFIHPKMEEGSME